MSILSKKNAKYIHVSNYNELLVLFCSVIFSWTPPRLIILTKKLITLLIKQNSMGPISIFPCHWRKKFEILSIFFIWFHNYLITKFKKYFNVYKVNYMESICWSKQKFVWIKTFQTIFSSTSIAISKRQSKIPPFLNNVHISHIC